MSEVFSVYRLGDGTLCCNWGVEMRDLLLATDDQGEHADKLIDLAEEWLADVAELYAAQGIEARRGETEGLDAQRESPVGGADAP
jgi:hypothetical protein